MKVQGEHAMKSVTLRAHFDGNHILLDEPFDLQPDMALVVTVLPAPESADEDEDAEWSLFSRGGLEAAYAEDESEYSLALIKEWNPEYEGG